MKKILLLISFVVLSLVTYAQQLNPFAYDLYVADDNPSGLADCVKGLHWSLNAKANTVKVIITDEAGNDYEYRSYGETNSGYFGTSLTRSRMIELNIPFGENLTWRVDVTGTSPSAPTELERSYSFWHPHAVAIDNNPNSAHFGRILVTESEPDIPASGYHSSGKGVGLYAFNADFTVVNAGDVYTGGKDFTRQIENSNGTEGYQPWIVRVSDDSRIFISSGDARADGTVVWEVNPDNLNEWSDLIKGTLVPYTNQADADPGVYHVKNASGNFLAGVNCSMDVRGSGSNLKLLLYSTDRRGLTFFAPANYHLHEYTIGTSQSYSGTPTQITHFGSTRYGHANRHAKVYYDGNYGFLFGGIYSNGDANSVPFAHALKSSSGTYTRKIWESNNTPRTSYDGGSGVKIHHSSTGQDWVFKGVKNSDGTNKGKFCVYSVSRNADGTPVLSALYTVTSARKGRYINDFALDYAENLYTVDNNAEKIQVYALPYSGKTSTPAALRYSFNIPCQSGNTYEVTTMCTPPEGGTIECSIAGVARGAGILPVESCSELTVTAIPEDGYKFIDWRDGNGNFISSSPQLTFMVTDDITLVAKFEYATYNVTWWNLFKDGEDIGKESTAYPGTNERLWRLYQIEFEKYNTSNSGDAVRWHYDSHQPNGVNKLQFNVGTFIYYGKRPSNNYNFLTASTTSPTTPFAWLGDYIEYVSGTTSSKSSHWMYIIYLFFNRTNKAYNATPADCTSEVIWTDNTKSFAQDYGMPEYWRPWWVEATCGLKKVMSYDDAMPVKWTQESCATGDIAKLGRFNGTAPASNKETQPSLWYKWNTAPDGKTYDQSQYLLAWRDGASGPIAHYVSRSDMELHASYVDKRLQESDPEPDLSIDPYDATNNDVLSLLNNKNYGATAHNVTMDRKFAGGMYNTICLPFDLPITHLPAKLQGADIRVFDGVTETYTESGDPCAVLNFITLDEYWDKWNAAHPDKQVANDNRYIEAGKPYLIKPSSDVNDEYLTYSGLPYWRFFDGTRTPYGISANGVTFQGVLNPTTLPENAYILVADNRIAKVTDTSDKILGYRGYFVINDIMLRTLADQGNVYFSMKKPVTTSIPVAPEAEQQLKPEVRKVMYDGQIYILRGDEVYTITGHRVK